MALSTNTMTSPDHRRSLREEFCAQCSLDDLPGAERTLLLKHGAWLEGLASKRLAPKTKAQEQFIAVHDGKVLPITAHELAWRRYRSKCLFDELCRLEQDLSVSSRYRFDAIAAGFRALAATGNEGARAWCARELGEDLEREFPVPLDRLRIAEMRAANDAGRSMATGFGPIRDATFSDYSDLQDDYDSSYWDAQLGGPDID